MRGEVNHPEMPMKEVTEYRKTIESFSGMTPRQARAFWKDLFFGDENGNKKNYDAPIGAEVHEILKNKQNGLDREKEVGEELKKKYPPEEGYQIIREVYLRNKDGDIVKDDKTDTARRIDYVVVKDGKVVDSIEVTSKTADKSEQTAREDRIRDAGGNYIKDKNGDLVEMPSTVHTRIERRE
ncbi:MAG: hypothetical protein NC123_04095 [Butyrivibrio sp.]|nr:hypothetical protein [Acetatifactor muris]MCM1558711.1 hypothetical protein [Butyrivibrio sp.]